MTALLPAAVEYAICPACSSYLETGVKGPRCPTCGELADLPAPAAPSQPITIAPTAPTEDRQPRCPVCLTYSELGPTGLRCPAHGDIAPMLQPFIEPPAALRFPHTPTTRSAEPREPILLDGMRTMIREIAEEQNSVAANIAGRIGEALAPLVARLDSLITMIEATHSKK